MTNPITPPPELAMHFRGVPLIPPLDCTDPQSWIAEQIYQMGATPPPFEPMTKQHKATPDDWAQQEDWANRSAFSDSSCIIELRDRIEALEAGQQPPQDKLDRLIAIDRDDFANSLVERVADAITAQATSTGIVNDRPVFMPSIARAAILEVAAALIDRWDSEGGSAWEAAKWLEQEATNA